MAIEQKWPAVAPQLFTANGTTFGLITIASTKGFKVKQKVAFSNTALLAGRFRVIRVLSETQLKVGIENPTQGLWFTGTDVSAWTVASGAYIYAEEQDKAKLKPEDIIQAVYDQEPTVALRNVLVDQFGDYYDSVVDTNGIRRLAVDAAVTIEGVTITVALDAFTKVPPDNAIAVGTEDGTKGGIKHALKVAANGLLQVQDLLAEASLSSIDTKLSSGITVSGTVNVGNFPSVQTVAVNNFPSVQAISGSVAVTNFPVTQVVSGTVNVGNFPAIQPISGSVTVSNFPAVQPISATSLPLPTGAATSANQVTEIAGLAAINTAQTDGTQKTQVTASVLPTGAATAANQVTGNTSLGSIDGKLNSLGQKTKAGSVPVTFPSDADPVKTIQLFTLPFDSITATYPTATQEVYQSRVGGIAGTVQQTATVNYTDASKAVFLNVAVV